MKNAPFYWEKDQFFLNGEPFRIYSGAIHYFRSLPGKWRELLQKLKDMGFNTVETYCAWNMHEPRQGEFCFDGRLDFENFLNIAQELGLYAIVRPGPYICAEFEFGGIPGWLLKDPSIRIRTSQPAYMNALSAYMDELMKRLVPHLITNGGNVLMLAAENEYGSFGNDTEYMNMCAKLLEDRGCDVPIFTSDGRRRMFLEGGHADGKLCCVDFGFHHNIFPEDYQYLMDYQPEGPKFNVEHWIGNFTQWGTPNVGYPAESAAREVKQNIEIGANFNLYMFHGGTNFEFSNGANTFAKDKENPGKLTYFADTTTYDYGAPLTEWGECTPKYFAIQKVMEEHLGKKLPKPEPVPLQNLGEVKLTEQAGLFANLDNIGDHFTDNLPHNMEHYGQSLGYILYRTTIKGIYIPKALIARNIHDRVHLYFNGVYRGTLERNNEKAYFELGDWFTNGGTLDLLVENMGRVGFGPDMLWGDRKGILEPVHVTADCRQFLFNWDVYCLPMTNRLDALSYVPNATENLPTFYRGTFKAEEQKDCFIHPDGFTKGFIVVNGFNLGKYWKIGPQYSIYLPGCILKEENEIIVFDEEPTTNPHVNIRDYHVLDLIKKDDTPDVIV